MAERTETPRGGSRAAPECDRVSPTATMPIATPLAAGRAAADRFPAVSREFAGMSDHTRPRKGAPMVVGILSIGALSRATGIPIETLRTWEHRYGFPVPERKPSGHRVYPISSIPRLRRIAEALGRGHRAGEVVAASEAALAELLEATSRPGAVPPPSGEASADTTTLLRFVRAFDGEIASGSSALLRRSTRLACAP